jgi:DNA helicase-2/ATP-dependent DNA helicase PcrA
MAATLHSLGMRAWLASGATGRPKVEGRKISNIVRSLTDRDFVLRKHAAAIRKLVSLAKAYGIAPDSDGINPGYRGAIGLIPDDLRTWLDLASHHDVELPSGAGMQKTVIEVARKALVESISLNDSMIDFDDMLYLPVIFGTPFSSPGWVFVDEAQDVSGIQRAMLRRMIRPGTSDRIVAVGDKFQSVYGFRGSDSESLANIGRDFDCDTLPLSVTYRCALSIVAEAQAFVKDITARDGAPQGEVIDSPEFRATDLKRDDLIICRNKAPLLTAAFALIGRGVPAAIMGRDIGKDITTTIENFRAGSIEDLGAKLTKWEAEQTIEAMNREDEAKADRIADKALCIRTVIENTPNARTVADITARVESLFADDHPNRVRLATIHKAKGLEADRVFILKRELLPSGYARQPWQRAQEANLEYVAVTRAKNTLVNVSVFV